MTRKQTSDGFTLVELMVVVAIIGLLAAIAVPSFMRYLAKAKTAEAVTELEKIYNGARIYYTEIGQNAQFPASEPATPAVSCCVSGGRCLPNQELWHTPTWDALGFSVDDPHYYRYGFDSSGTMGEAKFTAYANGDLDCDGKYSTFSMLGWGRNMGRDMVGSAGVIRVDELE